MILNKEIFPLFSYNKKTKSIFINTPSNNKQSRTLTPQEIHDFKNDFYCFDKIYKRLKVMPKENLMSVMKKLDIKYDPNKENIINLNDFQIRDGLNLSYSNNKLVSHQVRVGKTFTSIFGFLNRDDYTDIMIIANKSIISDLNGWNNSIINLAKDMNIDINLFNVANYNSDIKKKEAVKTFFKTKKTKNIFIINPEFFTASKIGKNVYDILISKKITFDLLIYDEIHEMLNLNAAFRLSSARAKKIIQLRYRIIRDCWAMSATPASKSHMDLMATYLFISFSKKYFYSYTQFDKLLGDIFNLLYTYNKDPFGGIDVSTIYYRQGTSDTIKQMTSVYRIGRIQTEINPYKKPLNIQKIEIEVEDYQKDLYTNLYKSINGVKLLKTITSKVAHITFLKEISLDHRLLKQIMKGLMETNFNKINFEERLPIKDVYYDIFIKHLSLYFESYLKTYDYVDELLKEDSLNWITLNTFIDNYFSNIKGFDNIGAKASWTIDYINKYYREFSEHPLLIFSNFSTFLTNFLMKDILAKSFVKPNEIEIINGSVSSKKRQEIFQRYNDGELKVLLLNIEATATGITLSKSNTSIYLDLPWRYNKFEQSISRIDELFAKNDKNILIPLISKKSLDIEDPSIDEVINEYLLKNKENIKFSITHYN